MVERQLAATTQGGRIVWCMTSMCRHGDECCLCPHGTTFPREDTFVPEVTARAVPSGYLLAFCRDFEKKE